MGYKATYAGKTGFVTAGHCGGVEESVGNPTNFSWDILGSVFANSFNTSGIWCDCSFVENTETTSSKVYDGQTVNGFLFPTMFDWLEFEGTSSQGVQGGITNTYLHIRPNLDGFGLVWVYGVVETTATTQGGDSGGSVIESTTGTPKFAGIIITDAGHYTPYYRITNSFSGISLS